jgi:oxalate decarboxylase
MPMNGNTTSKAGRRLGCSLPAPAQTQNFNPGDIGYVKRNNGHYVKNLGNTELQFLEVFKSPYFQDVSLSDWLTHTPPAMVAATFNMDPAEIAKWPKDKPETLPIYQR